MATLAALLLVTVVVVVTTPETSDVPGGAASPAEELEVVEVFTGEASFYGPGLPPDAVTASGAPFDPQADAAAHPTLPFGTLLRVTRLAGRAAVVVEATTGCPGRTRGGWT